MKLKLLVIFIALNGALATMLAALASHNATLNSSSYLVGVFDKASTQHYVHLLALLLVTIAYMQRGERAWLISGGLFALGITLFSYPLYLFSFTGAKIAGFLTPIGGVCFIMGWLALLVVAWRHKPRD
ncbi:MAG: DUF423 domain-containing protein [Psychrobium sp.]|nr:DUF423 domain-containing protein [Psychrobium sp.]